MPNIVLDGDNSVGHGGFPPTPIQASSSVTINGTKIALDGDPYVQHCNSGCHTPIAQGSSSVTVNGKNLVLGGDPLSCGDTATASSTVSVT